jgi:hypothetical protein
MFSFTVFSSNNETSGEEVTHNEYNQKSSVEKENCSDADETNSVLKNTVEVPDSTNEVKENKDDRQCGGSYTFGISQVDFIEYVPDLRLWLT